MPVPITQADRDAAAAYCSEVPKLYRAEVRRQIRYGERDGDPLVQAFARHRIATRPAIPEVDRVERDARAIWRCAIGDTVTALDALIGHWTAGEGAADAAAALGQALDLVYAAQDPAPTTHAEANALGKQLIARLKAAFPSPDTVTVDR